MLSRSSKFFSVFPPPAILNVPCAGLHIADDAIRAVVMHKNSISLFGERALPKGLVEGGTITNENALAQEIKALKEKLKLSFVRVSLPEERMYLFTIEIAGVSDLGVRDIVESKLEENIPIPPAEAIYEFEPCERKGNLITKVNVSAFSEKLVQSYLSCCTLAGLDVRGFETESRAIVKSLVFTEEVCLIVDISSYSVSMFVVVNKITQFSSTSSKDVIESEIKKIIEYWNTHGKSKEIQKIYVIGQTADISKFTSLPVTVGISKFNQSLDYAVAIGLAMNI